MHFENCEKFFSYEEALDSIDMMKNADSTLYGPKWVISESSSVLNNVTELDNNIFIQETIIKPNLILSDTSTYIDNLNYTKGCKWAPDGSCLLVGSALNYLHFYNLPHHIWNKDYHYEHIAPVKAVRQIDACFDYCWNPLMNSWDPQTCFIASTCRNSPIHLIDANDGHTKNTYKAYNHTEELKSCYSIAFSHDSRKILGGYDKSIKIFDVENMFSFHDTIITHNKLFSSKGQHGIISCFDICDKLPNLFVAGSYTSSIGLYTLSDNTLVSLLHGSQGGITYLRFSPDGSKLYSGGRKDPHITCWDLRNMGKVCQTYDRPVTNNQRLYFDLKHAQTTESNDSFWLASGTMDGSIKFWDLSSNLEGNIENTTNNLPVDSEVTGNRENYKFQAHSDTVNGVSFHPKLPLLATCSGRRHIKCKSFKRRKSNPLGNLQNNGGFLTATSNNDAIGSDSVSSLTDSDEESLQLLINHEIDAKNSLKIWHLPDDLSKLGEKCA